MFQDNLRRLRKEKGLTQRQLADKLFVDCSTITKYETGKAVPDYTKQQKLADFFNVSLDFLMGRIDHNISTAELPANTFKIPVLGRIPAGVPFEAIEDISGYIEIPEDWISGGKEFFALKIKGDSMSPDYLCGDIVVFERAETCDTGDDCAVMVNGDDATFKRVERKETGVVLKPLNPEYETLFFSNDEIETKPVRILGIARELRRIKK